MFPHNNFQEYKVLIINSWRVGGGHYSHLVFKGGIAYLDINCLFRDKNLSDCEETQLK